MVQTAEPCLHHRPRDKTCSITFLGQGNPVLNTRAENVIASIRVHKTMGHLPEKRPLCGWDARRSVKEHGLERARLEATRRRKAHFGVSISSHIHLSIGQQWKRRAFLLPVRIASMHRLRVLLCLMHSFGFSHCSLTLVTSHVVFWMPGR